MMNTIFSKTKLLVVGCVVCCCSCTEEVLEQPYLQESPIKEVTFLTKPFIPSDLSRTAFDITDNVKEYWVNTDTIGVFPLNGAQSYFPMLNGENISSATFTGGGWALLPSTKYAAYYPFDFENRYVNSIGISYLNQSQNENADTGHLGRYDYMAANMTTPESGEKVSFEMEHLGALVSIKLNVPKGGYKSLKLITDSTFAVKSKMDLSQSKPVVSVISTDDSIRLDLNNVEIGKDNDVLSAYLFVPPVDLSTSKLSVKATNMSNVELVYDITPTNFEASKFYQLSAESYTVLEESVKYGLDGLQDTLRITLNNMVSNESGFQGYGGEPGLMIARDVMADDITWQKNTWFVSPLKWTCNLNGESNYNVKYWEFYYNRIREVNKLQEYLEDIEPYVTENTKVFYNLIKGEALCIRAWAHFNLVQMYAKPYISGGNNSQAGVPYRESSEIVALARHTVEEVYEKINRDLDEACSLLQDINIENIVDWNKKIEHYTDKVAWGLKARVALAMGDYVNASEYAAKAITLAEADGHTLMQGEQLYHGFSSISDKTSEALIADRPWDEETVYFYSFYAYMSWNFSSIAVRQGVKAINADTYGIMSETDLRREWWDPTGKMSTPLSSFVKIPYQNRKFMAYSISNSVGNVAFMRLAELYLMQAEALARAGQDASAQEVFTKFQITRDPAYVAQGNTGDALINEIMNSRRIELWGEGFRFTDLKRLHLPIKRGRNFDTSFCAFLEMDADATGWVWEIPKSELESNPLCTSNY